ncbi:unnamed protein product [Amoebophrya sp. A120]|nr:unnamed protein product [Amoebophrya sp. A120]CAD7960253.1 unnamed protein product [Amoebophrya sp. A120]|eukprot:GSA120T00020132001.1
MTDAEQPLPPGLEEDVDPSLLLAAMNTGNAAAATEGQSYTAAEWAEWMKQQGLVMAGPPGAPAIPGAVAPAVAPAAAPAAAPPVQVIPVGQKGASSSAANGNGVPAPAPPVQLDEDGRPPIIRGGLISEKAAEVQVEWADADYREALLAAESWDSLNLTKELMEGIHGMNYVRPSRIQAAALPLICPPKSKNMIGQAANGSGKTATFSLGMLANIDPKLTYPQAMVMAPTRELANQTEEVVMKLGKFMGIKVLKVLPQGDRIEKGKCEAHILVGTPGRIYDVTKKRILNVDRVKVFILDEADVMLDQENQMGRDVASVRKWLSPDCQVLFFSATYPDHVREFAKAIVPNAAKITVQNKDLAIDTILSFYQQCANNDEKYQALKEIYAHLNVGQSIIFMNSRKTAFEVSVRLRKDGYAVSLICGTQQTGPEKIDPAHRDKVMDEFRRGITKVLVATDVLARGIDVPAVTLVVNYEIPTIWTAGSRIGDREANGETYLHRTGRTGRFGMKGIAVNMVDRREKELMLGIQKQFNIKTITDLEGDYELLEERLKQARKVQ